METFIEHLPYVGVVVILLIAGFGLPLPEDLPLIAGGIMCGLGDANIYIMVPLCFAAVLGADVLIFSMGHWHGDRVRQWPFIRKVLTDERLERVSEAYHDHVGKTLFTARFLPGLRTALFFTAGSVGIPYWKMLVFDGLAALISVPALVLAGYFGAANKDLILELARDAQMAVLGVLLLIVGGYVGLKWMRKKRSEALNKKPLDR